MCGRQIYMYTCTTHAFVHVDGATAFLNGSPNAFFFSQTDAETLFNWLLYYMEYDTYTTASSIVVGGNRAQLNRIRRGYQDIYYM